MSNTSPEFEQQKAYTFLDDLSIFDEVEQIEIKDITPQQVDKLISMSLEFSEIVDHIHSLGYKMGGLIQHDIVKDSNFILSYLELIADNIKRYPDTDNTRSYEIVKSHLSGAKGSMELYKSILEGNPNLTLDGLTKALGFTGSGSTFVKTNQNKKEVTLKIDVPNFKDLEEFFTTSTLILNATNIAGVSEIQVKIEVINGIRYLTVIDNGTDGEFTKGFANAIKEYFCDGLVKSDQINTNSMGGGKLAAFYTGQRAAVNNPKTDLNNTDVQQVLLSDYITEIHLDLPEKTPSKFKGFKFRF